MPTPVQTISLQYGPLSGFTSSTFSWTVTNVDSSGTFVDGTPWFVMGSTGSYLTNILPRSEGKTTTHTNSRYPQLVNVYISGSVKNPKTQHEYYDPATMNEVVSPVIFDQRVCFAGAGDGTQSLINSLYGLTFNIGYTIGGTLAALNSVGLTFNDMIVTADSIWFDQNHPLYGLTFNTGPAQGTVRFGFSETIPNSTGIYPTKGGSRSPIKRYGVLTVLKQGLTQESFRPPVQWKTDISTRSQFIVPLSHAKSVSTIASIFGHQTTDQSIYSGLPFRSNQYLDSLVIHGGNEIRRQSDNPMYGGENTDLLGGIQYEVYPVLSTLLFDMTNTNNTVAQRELARNRFIQYGIDAYGAVLSGVDGGQVSGAHRNCELLPSILITGWLIGATFGDQMIDIYNTLRSNFPGLTGLSDERVGDYFFGEWSQFAGVTTNPETGRSMRQTWSPSSPNGTYVTSAEIITQPSFHENYADQNLVGKFGKLNVAGGNYPSTTSGRGFYRYDTNIRSGGWYNYPGCYLKVTSGPGSGNTIYKILDVGKLTVGSVNLAADYIVVDRPWFSGLPDATSTVECYPFRNGIHSFDGSTADIGRYYYTGAYEAKYSSANGVANNASLSYRNILYGSMHWSAKITFMTFLKKLFEITGNVNFISSNAFKWYTDVVGGYNRYIGDNSLLGNTPRQEYIQNIKWNEIYGSVGANYTRMGIGGKSRIPILQNWMGITGATQFGKAEWSTFPGQGLTYNASGMSRVLANWGGPGNSDFNGDGITDSLDLAFITSNWGS